MSEVTYTTHDDTNYLHLSLINRDLKAAIRDRDKARILDLYDFAKTVDFDELAEDQCYAILEEYDNLVDQGNEILGV